MQERPNPMCQPWNLLLGFHCVLHLFLHVITTVFQFSDKSLSLPGRSTQLQTTTSLRLALCYRQFILYLKNTTAQVRRELSEVLRASIPQVWEETSPFPFLPQQWNSLIPFCVWNLAPWLVPCSFLWQLITQSWLLQVEQQQGS